MAENDKTEKLLSLGPAATLKAYQDILKKVQGGEILRPGEIKSFELLEKKLQAQVAAVEKTGGLPPTLVNGLEEVAAHFGKSLRQVQRWRRSSGFPPALSGGRYDLVQIQGWLDHRNGGRGAARPGETERRQWNLPEESGKDFWDKEGKKYQAKMREMEYRRLRGELVEWAAVEQMFVARILAVKQGIMGLSRSLPPQLAALREEREIEVVIRRAVHHLLEDFSRPLPENLQAGAPVCTDSEVAQGG